ncbi:MAG: DNA mismatch repair protein [bacterium]|nr:DNA mismatch repair protein [bacterium]
MNPIESYKKRKEDFTQLLEEQTAQYNRLSRIRLLVFAAGGAGLVILYTSGLNLMAALLFAAIFAVFIYLVKRHDTIDRERRITTHLIGINANSIQRLQGKWLEFKDDGEEFVNRDHKYTLDLDIFGHGSLYQWVSRANTYYGRIFLGDLLKEPEKRRDAILNRQEAVWELSEKIDWRQKFQAEGMERRKALLNPELLVRWAEEPERVLAKTWQRALVRILPAAAVLLAAAAILVPAVPAAVPALFFCLQLLVAWINRKKASRVFELTGKYKDQLQTYQELLRMVEQEEFTAPYLAAQRQKTEQKAGEPASEQVRKLDRITDYMGMRFSSLHFLVNMLFLWDYQCIIALENWKERSGAGLRSWLEAIGRLEAVSSLAGARYDNPDWAKPLISHEAYHYSAEEISHPLLPAETRVTNDFRIEGPGSILIITGSNMSGKSTMLRIVGINLVLAYAGAPVCAKTFTCSLMDIYSSMRVNDNLEKNISSFYAELLRVKMIIEASRREEPMMFLLDEIFRGTNSRDRQIGAATILRDLSRKGVAGLVSTHDLELAGLEEEPDLAISNYYFKEGYTDDTIYFDYIMRRGVSNTSDAIYLMRMIGLEV